MTTDLTAKTSPAEWADRISTAWRKSTATIIKTGQLLIKAKDEVEHGELPSCSPMGGRL